MRQDWHAGQYGDHSNGRQEQQHRLKNLVVDPVMVATSGDPLIKNAVTALRSI
jgi:hydroxymethylpyrimidine/phosphomethylpyrimidine kinase